MNSLQNIFTILSFMTPIILVFLFFFISIINQNVKGLVFIAGALFASFINVILQQLIKSPKPYGIGSSGNSTTEGSGQYIGVKSHVCDMYDVFSLTTKYNEPASSSVFVAFTIAYLVLPMTFNNQMNYGLIVLLFAIFAVDAISKSTYGCNSIRGIGLGGVTGLILGAAWYSLLHSSGNDNILYFDELDSNNVLCKKPSKQKFKCAVYKNGEIITNKNF